MDKTGYRSKRFALDVAGEIRETLVEAYPVEWQCTTYKRGTKWFCSVDLMAEGQPVELQVRPAECPLYSLSITTTEYADSITGYCPIDLVIQAMGRIQSVLNRLRLDDCSRPYYVREIKRVQNRLTMALTTSA